MKIIRPSVELLDKEFDGVKEIKKLELAGRLCYKSEDKITDDSYKGFIKHALDLGHHSLIEHVHITARVICDRGVTHEIVRHRIANYSQESTRYCNYTQGKYGSEITVILPVWYRNYCEVMGTPEAADMKFVATRERFKIWKQACEKDEKDYIELINLGAQPQEARDILPNSLKTEIIMTFNIREWRHFFTLRAHKGSHPQMQEVAHALLKLLKSKVPVVFDEFTVYDGPLADIR